jgi:hypothetical protein
MPKERMKDAQLRIGYEQSRKRRQNVFKRITVVVWALALGLIVAGSAIRLGSVAPRRGGRRSVGALAYLIV